MRKLQKIKELLAIQRLQTFSDRDAISFSLDYIDWLIEQTEKAEKYELALKDIQKCADIEELVQEICKKALKA